jgi:hypothetical protein
VHDDAPYLMKSRWALSYLRGPLTGAEIARVMAPRKAALRAAAAGAGAGAGAGAAAAVTAGAGAAAGTAGRSGAAAASPPAAAATAPTAPRPVLPAEVAEYFLAPTGGEGPISYRPMVMGAAKLHFVDAKLGLDQWSTTTWLAPLADDGKQVLWAEGAAQDSLRNRLSKAPASGAADYAPLPGPALRAATWPAYGKGLGAHLFENLRRSVLLCEALKMSSAPGEPEGDFRARLAQSLREKRDAARDTLGKAYASKLQTIDDQIRRAEDRVAREGSQATQQKLQTALSVGTTIFGALFGSKRLSATSVSRAATAARSAARIGKESEDVDRASDSLEVLRQRKAELEAKAKAELDDAAGKFDPGTVALREVAVTPRKSDLAIGEVALVWTPWRRGADGFAAPAFE